jgi:alpha-D-ribose 1-methylphosphonate 5-triphosphate synthase subunit PhnL
MVLLDVEDFAKRFTIHQLGRTITAFTDVTFTLRAGELVLVRGPNGVGKSTLLRCLYRTYLPTSGIARYHSLTGPIDLARAADVDIVHLRRHELGHVTQFLRPRPRVSALDFVAEPLLAEGIPRDDAYAEAAHWLDAFGLKREIWAAYPSTFSGGEQQKTNLVHALIHPRRLLLLDEPTAALDAHARAALADRLDQLKRQGVAMLGVFHHPEDVAGLIDREIVLRAAECEPNQEQWSAYVAD